MRALRTRRQVINRAVVSRVPTLLLGLSGVVLGIVHQSWQIALVGVVIMILPAVLVVFHLRRRSRLSDAELNAPFDLIRPTLRAKGDR